MTDIDALAALWLGGALAATHWSASGADEAPAEPVKGAVR
jgi:hypothetical protein